ncbi:MAG: co-chaperone YbbN [Proteobacteria bacterium]|nr:co-chaperone YbbN [Pseudomonadota bacterium]
MSKSPYIHNVSAQNFQALVIENSLKQPVLVDFWADWCEPCKTVMPMLAKLAEEYAGKFILAKVDTEQEKELAAHFSIKSLPTMKLFVKGQVADERIGVIPESEVRAFIDAFVTSELDKIVRAAMQALDEGRAEDALALMNQALAKDPENADLKISIAKIVAAQGDRDSALALLDTLSDEDNKKDEAVKLRAEIEVAKQLENAPALPEIEQRLSDDPNDLEALLQKSRHLSASADYDEAMECLLKIMTVDRQFEDDLGRTSLISLFDLLGGEHPSVQKYRRKMFTLLH